MRLALAALSLAAPALAACAIPTPSAFYNAPALAGQPPGTIISAEPFSPPIQGAAAYRVLYNSKDIYGATIPVSGVIYIPTAPAPPGGRNTVAWAHPTTGIAPGCAPSLDTGDIGGITTAQSIPGLADFISAGDIVAATDYQGMGAAAGVHPYLVGQAEAQNVLDSVRAAKFLAGANLNGNFAVWGHSQGAQAALFTGQYAKPYAPELHLAGVAAAAPVTDMKGEFAEPFQGNIGRDLGAYVYHSWSIIFHVPITSVVLPEAVPNVTGAAQQCISSLGMGINAVRAGAALNPVFLSKPPAFTPPWTGLFEQNSPGAMPPGAPLLIVQGTADPTVEPYWTRGFVGKVCAKHETLQYIEVKGEKHLLIAYKTAPYVATWIADRFAGKPPPDNCKTDGA